MVKLNLEVFIGTGNLFFNSSIKPDRTGQFRIWHDEQKGKWILDSELHNYMTTNSNITWGHFEQYSGDFDSGMVFQYFKNLDSDSSAFSVRLKRFPQKNGKMYVPALYGNTQIINAQNKQTSYCGVNSIPKYTLYSNVVQPVEQKMKYYICVQPQSYTVLI